MEHVEELLRRWRSKAAQARMDYKYDEGDTLDSFAEELERALELERREIGRDTDG